MCVGMGGGGGKRKTLLPINFRKVGSFVFFTSDKICKTSFTMHISGRLINQIS